MNRFAAVSGVIMELHWRGPAEVAAVLIGSILAGLLLHGVVFRILRRVAAGNPESVTALISRQLCAPSRLLFPLLALLITAPALDIQAEILGTFRHAVAIVSILFIAAVAWLLIRLTAVLQEVLLKRFQMDVQDNLRARKIHTQLGILRRILIVLIAVIAERRSRPCS